MQVQKVDYLDRTARTQTLFHRPLNVFPLFCRGILKVAEVESRFQDFPVEQFTSAVERCGFKLKLKDLSNKYFYIFDFTKTDECKKKIPEFSLKPCYYKKR